MERGVHPGKLSDLVFARAVPGDDKAIRQLLRRVPMRGDLRIGFEREPSCFACTDPAGCHGHMVVARRGGHLVGVGEWSGREVWLGGERRMVGYLHGLRLEPGLPGSMRVLREGYAFLAGEISGIDATIWFTSIDAANPRARRVLESRANGLPRYDRAANYLTKVWPVRCRLRGGCAGVMDTREELTDFLNHEGARHDLSLCWDEARWQALERSGFSAKDVVVIRDGGKVAAVAGVWDQRSWRQLIVHRYPRWMRVARLLCHWAGPGVGWPRWPAEGAVAAIGHVFPFAVAAGAESTVARLWQGVQDIARRRGINWLALGLDEGDPLWRDFRGAVASYSTVIYHVHGHGIPGGGGRALVRPIRPECAVL